MVNLDSLLLLIRMQQLEQLQKLNVTEDTTTTTDSSTDFASILSNMLSLMGGSEEQGITSDLNLGSDTSNGLGLNAISGTDSLSNSLTGNLTNLDRIFNDLGAKYGLSPNLLKSVANAESGLNPNAVSPAGAQGLMQLMPATAKGLGVTDSFDPVQNIEGGAKYLRSLLDRFDNNLPLALAAYNAGPNAVKRYGGIPPYKETQKYVQKIMDNLVDLTG